MSDDREQRVKELLAQLLDTPARERAGVLELACAQDAGMRSEVESLAQAYEDGGDFLAASQSITVSPAVFETAGSHIGRYTILEKIGEGGFGTVFLAEQMHPVRRTVALKILKAGMDTKQVIARFSAERQALAMMDHPNVAKVLDAGATDSGRPYFVMDLIRGTPITRYCDQHKLTIRQRLELFLQVCQGVQHAHTKGIIHRDLKPSNVLVTESDGIALPKVIDFGIAKATTGQLTDQTLLTELRQLLGTPQYMSPEQADGSADIDTRSDVYSLGVILYELLSGSTPFEFDACGFAEIHRIIREVEPPPPSTRASQRELRGDLDRIVLKATEKDRKRRYETASTFASDIQHYLNNEPVTAHRAGRVYRLRKLVRRNKLAFGAAAAITLTLAAGLITSTSLYIKARDAKTAQSILRDGAEANAYASDMNLIQQALAVNNLGRARELLDRHRPKPGEKDRRGWEWRYLWQQCRSDAAFELRRPTGVHVAVVALSGDGRWLAVDEDDGDGLSIWDLETRKEISHPTASRDWVTATFSPREPLLAYTSATADAQGHQSFKLSLWDVRINKVIASAKIGKNPQRLAFSADGKLLLVCNGTEQGGLTFRRVPELTETGVGFPLSITGTYLGVNVAATQDLSSAAIVFSDQQVGIVNLKTGGQWRESIAGPVTSVALSPDGQVMAFSSGTAPAAIHLRNATTGERLGPPIEGHSAWVGQLVFWPDGKTLASAGADQTIRLWDVSDPGHAKPIGRPLRGHRSEIWTLALLPDNRTLVSGAKDGAVYIWDSSKAREDLSHRVFAVVDWSFGTVGASVTVVEPDGQVERLDGRTFSERHPILKVDGQIRGAVLGDRGRVLTCWFSDRAKTWDIVSMHVWHTHPRVAHGEGDFWAVTPERHLLHYFAADDQAVEWDPVEGRELASWHPMIRGIKAYAVSDDGRWRVTLGGDGAGVIAEAGGRTIPFDLNMRWTEGACLSPDSSLLAVNSGTGFAGLWKRTDLLSGGVLHPAAMLGGFILAPHSLAFSPDGARLAVGGVGSEAIKLYDVGSAQEVLNLAATGSMFVQTQFSPDGNVLASRSYEDELHLWRAPTLAEIDAAEANGIAR